ncbi:MAG: DUF935 family protein [Salinibacterium sp.]|nr:MAG: DUF935 family protein [Salinibacterium sp.]
MQFSGLAKAASSVISFLRRPVTSVWMTGQADQFVFSVFHRPTAKVLQQARAMVQFGDPSRWFALANESMRDSQIRADVKKAAGLVSTARISIQEPKQYRGWGVIKGPDTDAAAQVRSWVEDQLAAPSVKLRSVLYKWARAVLLHGMGGIEVISSVDPTRPAGDEERLESLTPIPGQRFGWDWNRGGQMVLRYKVTQPIVEAPTVESLGSSVMLVELDADIPDPSLRGITAALLPLWILRDSAVRWWARLAEKFTIPILWATVPREDGAAGEESRRNLQKGMQRLGPDGAGVFLEGTKLNVLDTSSTKAGAESPAQKLFESTGREISKLIHGHGQTSEVQSDTGSQSSAGVGDVNVLRTAEAFMQEFAGALREQWARHAVARRFGPEWADKFTPEFEMSIYERQDLQALSQAFLNLRSVAPVTKADFYKITGLSVPEKNEPCIDAGPPPGAAPVPGAPVQKQPPPAGADLPREVFQ